VRCRKGLLVFQGDDPEKIPQALFGSPPGEGALFETSPEEKGHCGRQSGHDEERKMHSDRGTSNPPAPVALPQPHFAMVAEHVRLQGRKEQAIVERRRTPDAPRRFHRENPPERRF
jgi:hypothetical protein